MLAFLDFSSYKPGIFKFSPDEKAQFLKDFLAAISVSRIDALVVHSSGIYPGLQLCLDNNPVIKSLIMLCPGTYTFDMKATKYIKLMRKLVALSENPLFLKLFQPIAPIVLKLANVPVRVENMWDPLLSAATMVNGDVLQAKEKFHTLAQRGFPMLYAFSKDDKLIGKEASYNLAYLLGASDADIYTYDMEGNITNKGKDNSSLKVMAFESGSHYVFWKHPDIIYKAIEDFMEKL
ncbi:uncharacterized protein CEXT_146711 [Caerostris extrusa]|uniref:Alpha/beta hydrolase n=1 Tax=Caerostris extrusa TaxID=172846 RepID=A0AAV4VXA2_CAEEX|nr:uncharacterized protein CEXT_146711 [Caerostris extrusa]